jgi:hypothetical protein
MAEGKAYVAYEVVYKAWDDPGIPIIHTFVFSTFDKAKAFVESRTIDVCKVKTLDPRYRDGEWERWEECEDFYEMEDECETAHFKLSHEEESMYSSHYFTYPVVDKDGDAVERGVTHWYVDVCEVDAE